MSISKRRAALSITAVLTMSSVGFLLGMKVERDKLSPGGVIQSAARVARVVIRKALGDGGSHRAPGLWNEARSPGELASEANQLSAIGYLDAYVPAKTTVGVQTLERSKVQTGLTLITSGHAPEATLIDLEGEPVFQWVVHFDEVWRDPYPFTVRPRSKAYLRRARVLSNGDLIAVFDYMGLIKVDSQGSVLWAHGAGNHHDFDLTGDGHIYALAADDMAADEVGIRYPEIPIDGPLTLDYVELLDSSGMRQRRFSIFDALYRSKYASYLWDIQRSDALHTNSIDVIESPIAAHSDLFREGDLLVSLHSLNAIAVIDPDTERVKWALRGIWTRQHQASYLENGNILLFDNYGGGPDRLDQSAGSRVLEVDPLTQEIVWRFPQSQSRAFQSTAMGYNQRLANGNTLITESTNGRLVEVTPQGTIVWEYLNPHRGGENNELVATLMGGQRLDEKDLPFLRDIR